MSEEKKGPGRPKKEEEKPELKSVPKLEVGMLSKNGLWKIVEKREVPAGSHGDTEIRWIVEPTPENNKFLGKTPMLEDDAVLLMEGKFNHGG
jgi:hypothetical protein